MKNKNKKNNNKANKANKDNKAKEQSKSKSKPETITERGKFVPDEDPEVEHDEKKQMKWSWLTSKGADAEEAYYNSTETNSSKVDDKDKDADDDKSQSKSKSETGYIAGSTHKFDPNEKSSHQSQGQGGKKNVRTNANTHHTGSDLPMNCIALWDNPNEPLHNKIKCSILSNATNHPAGLLTAILTICFICYCGVIRKNRLPSSFYRRKKRANDMYGEYSAVDAYDEVLDDYDEDYRSYINNETESVSDESVETIISKWSEVEPVEGDIEMETPELDDSTFINDFTDDNELSLQEVNG